MNANGPMSAPIAGEPGRLTVSDQNQRELSGPPRVRLMQPTAAAEDGVIRTVLVMPKPRPDGAELGAPSQGLGGSFDASSGQTVSTTALISSVTVLRTGVSTT